jgi:hypothetical protein
MRYVVCGNANVRHFGKERHTSRSSQQAGLSCTCHTCHTRDGREQAAIFEAQQRVMFSNDLLSCSKADKMSEDDDIWLQRPRCGMALDFARWQYNHVNYCDLSHTTIGR